MSIDLEALYIDLHQHPELSFQETRTAGIAAGQLRDLGLEVHEGVGGTGVVGVLANGDAPTVWARADVDALPVTEETGLPYASKATGVDPDVNEVRVMHACGHDMHVTAMIGAVEQLVWERDQWQGTLVVVIQPAEELGAGARAMLDDGALDRFPKPDIVLGQHVGPLPAGAVGLRPGPQMSASDGLHVVLHGQGGHGSRPDSTIDPVVMAAATIMRLQTIVSREEDVSWFARDAGVPLVFWFWGGVDPAAFAAALQNGSVDHDIPTNHSPFFAPVIHPTIEVGVKALATAAREFLG
ncbi:MAG: amidohydrolase [Microbacterium sp. 69-10]|uniref:amidohydrolase n=1 Tax=Microbacterium sp. 69-10 TaxID=1895783 RepID=UPI000960A95E|nr:amidohydrolase [Microbacterium sp. 69-10]OJU41069.1 MAG: amidohydrolase [Microbacterium sp. 69-10]